MADTIFDRFKRSWNAFRDRDPTDDIANVGPGSSYRQDRYHMTGGNERSFVASLYARISVDVAAIGLLHARLDENDMFVDKIRSGLNNCLALDPNIDQTGRSFMQDVVLSMFDEGSVAIVPVDTTTSPKNSNSYDILSMRTGKIVQWFPRHIRVNVYNDRTGQKQDIILLKKDVAIVENPLYSFMNEPNSTLKRLIEKLNILDGIDRSGGKLDIVVQLPYAVKTPERIKIAEARRLAIEDQLKNAQYGIAYIDGVEKITQLNRPAENQLLAQITTLKVDLYNQLGLTQAIFDGTAGEKELINYHNRTIEPILAAIADPMRKSFLTPTARTQGQTITYFKDPFKLIPASEIATIADTFIRNTIFTKNEFRGIMGRKPSSDPEANKLSNPNLNQPASAPAPASQPATGAPLGQMKMSDLEKRNNPSKGITNG